MASRLKNYLTKTLDQLLKLSPETLVSDRYEKFRKMGTYLELMEDGTSETRGHVITG